MSIDRAPARYFPFESGRYQVKAGLTPISRSFGNGEADHLVFQFDRQFDRYRRCKLAARAERLSKYFARAESSDISIGLAVSWIAERLAKEQPRWFTLADASDGGRTLTCELTGERLTFDVAWRLVAAESDVSPGYVDGLDALACQVQEDIAVVAALADSDRLEAVHLCFPNHWSPEDKVGRDFAAIHEPVAEIDPLNRRATQLVDLMTKADPPVVRFAWGVATDDRLNHHPLPPDGAYAAADAWNGRRFDPDHPQAWLRIERQVMAGLNATSAGGNTDTNADDPMPRAAIFTIRTYFEDVASLRRDAERSSQLFAAIESMSAETLAYKGLTASRDDLLAWLRSGAWRRA